MQTDTVRIREATPADLPAILAIYESADITAETAFNAVEAEVQLEKFSRYPFYRLFVATSSAGRVVGTYEFLLMDNLAKHGQPSAIVEDVAVDRSAHGIGVGTAMMAHARQLAKSHGAYKLALSSNRRREGAHAFYRSLGFEQHGLSFAVDP